MNQGHNLVSLVDEPGTQICVPLVQGTQIKIPG